MRVIAQWKSIGMESQSPWVGIPVAPPSFPTLSLFQRSNSISIGYSSIGYSIGYSSIGY